MYKIPKHIKAFLFDMDGTLVNTEPVGPQVFAELFKKYGVIVTQDESELFNRVWRRESTDINENDYLSSLVDKYKITKSHDDFIQEFYIDYKKEIIKAGELPGTSGFLRKATEIGIKLALVTSSKRDQAEAILRFHKWDDLFTEIVSEEDITNFKPDPEPYLLALNKLDVKSEDSIVFEDAGNGVRSGKSARIFVVGLRAGNELKQDLKKADIVVESFNDILV
jgi:beta-phosphoglucomutase